MLFALCVHHAIEFAFGAFAFETHLQIVPAQRAAKANAVAFKTRAGGLSDARGADVLTHNASNAKVSALISYNLTPFDEGLVTTLDWYKTKFKDSK